MASPLNINPNIIKPQPGMGGESAAASSGAIVSGIEKELNIKKTDKIIKDNKVDMKEVDKFIEKLTETTTVQPVRKYQEKREQPNDENDRGRQKRKTKKTSGGAKTRAFEWMNKVPSPPKPIVLRSGLTDKFLGKIDPSVIVEYTRTYVKTQLGIPKEGLEGARAKKKMIEAELLQKGVPSELLSRINEAIDRVLSQDLSRLIKTAILRGFEGKRPAEWLIDDPRAETLINFAQFSDDTADISRMRVLGITGKILKQHAVRNWNIKQKDPGELMLLAEGLKIDINSWMASFLNEKIRVKEDGSVILDSSILEDEWKKSRLLDEFKMLHIALLMEDDFFNRFFIGRRLGMVEMSLVEGGFNDKETKIALFQAKNIAWGKVVTDLKNAHLKRVFSSSERQFEKLSGLIDRLTKKARRIGMGISKEGAILVEAKVHEMALETAVYKLELLRSTQSIEHDKGREKDILWLTHVTDRLKGAEERTEILEHVINFFGRMIGRK